VYTLQLPLLLLLLLQLDAPRSLRWRFELELVATRPGDGLSWCGVDVVLTGFWGQKKCWAGVEMSWR